MRKSLMTPFELSGMSEDEIVRELRGIRKRRAVARERRAPRPSASSTPQEMGDVLGDISSEESPAATQYVYRFTRTRRQREGF